MGKDTIQYIKDVGWHPLYCFTQDEWFPADYETASHGVSTLPVGFFWENVVCMKCFALSDDETASLLQFHIEGDPDPSTWVGRLVLFKNEVKRRVGNRSEVRIITTELQRVRVLREDFSVDVQDADIQYISGRKPAFERYF